MTIWLVGEAEDAWFPDQVYPFLEAGYFDTEADAQAWIDSGDYIQAKYDEHLAFETARHEERSREHEALLADYEKAKTAGLLHLVSAVKPGPLPIAWVDSFEKFSKRYHFQVMKLDKA